MKNNKLLAIAITDYNDVELNKIANCKSDVEKILKILSEKYIFDDIQFIHEKEKTTRTELYNLLNKYFINTMPDDNVLIIYAGHGAYNPHLSTSYWQPSDAELTDPSSWFNIADLLTFIKASRAFHISIMADTCFSGGIFEDTSRGGGIEAIDTKKSRLALTSGSLEKVSDGSIGELSPFTETLVRVLTQNKSDEFPFTTLSNQVILDFPKLKTQTPKFGELKNVGHDGGSFIFKLNKGKSNSVGIPNENEFLQQELKHLFIKLPQECLDKIKDVTLKTEEKIAAVKEQNFEKAGEIRQVEVDLITKLIENTSNYVGELENDIEISAIEIKRSKDLDSEYKNYQEILESKNDSSVKKRQFTNKKINQYFEGASFIVDYTNPASDFFDNLISAEKHSVKSGSTVK